MIGLFILAGVDTHIECHGAAVAAEQRRAAEPAPEIVEDAVDLTMQLADRGRIAGPGLS